MRSIRVGVLLACATTAAVAEPKTNGAALIFGDGIAFTLGAPAGWVLDDAAARDQGIDAVFYPKGEQFDQTPAFAYARTIAKQPHQTAAQLIDQAIATMRHAAPKLVVDPAKAWTCGANS